MNRTIFENIYKFSSLPVVICNDDESMTVFFANTEARLLLSPSYASDQMDGINPVCVPLNQFMRFSGKSDQVAISQSLKNTGALKRFQVLVEQAENTHITLTLSVNKVQLEGVGYIVIYIINNKDDQETGHNDILASILNTTYYATDIDYTMRLILSSVGEYINVSRVYVFEDLFNNHVRNTYEWCAPNVEPVIHTLQNVCKDDYHHDAIINPSGLYVADDIRELPDIDRAVLEPQGVRAIAILPLFHRNVPIGYIGYDDCRNTRKWHHKELVLLKEISSIISSLIIRRNAEADLKHSRETLQTVSDNIEPIIYVNDLKTYRLKFVNRSLAETFGAQPWQLIGKPCWEVLQNGVTEPCPFCPIPKMLEMGGEPGTTIEWEHFNTAVGAWFWVKDSIIRWVDGSLVHFETAIDITLRKEYEKQLQHFASTDTLTSVFNREWGTKLLRQEHYAARESGSPAALCFIDLDDLKGLNDAYGHEVGDAAIMNTCGTIRRRIRKDDMICRWGGDEFIVLLKCGAVKADEIMKSIQGELINGRRNESEVPLLMFSYGVIDIAAAETVEDAIALADKSMYHNKRLKKVSK